METVFDISAVVAVVATLMVIAQSRAVHALLYLTVSLLAVAVVFFTLGAPFVAALEVIIYAGAIMVLFVFVIMMLNLGAEAARQERRWLTPADWFGPAILGAILLAEMVWVLASPQSAFPAPAANDPRAVGAALFGPYVLVADLAALVLLAGLVGAYHFGRRSAEAGEGEAP